MNRIERMLEELAPEGVEWDSLGNRVSYEQPTKYLVKSVAYSDDFTTPVLTPGKTFILGYTDEKEGICLASKNEPVIIFDDFTAAFKWVDFPFKVKSSAMKILRTKSRNSLDLRFFYHFLKTLYYEPQDHTRQWIATVSRFRCPVPPVEIRREVVRILDKFTQLEAELEAELEARRQQYEHLCSMTFSRVAESGVTWSTLGAVARRVVTGATPRAGDARYYRGGEIPWLRTAEVAFSDIWDTEGRVTDAALQETGISWIPENSVIVAISGATAGRVAVNRIPLTTNQHCCNLIVDEEVAYHRYVFHWIRSQYASLKGCGRGARSDLNVRIIKGFPIPVPHDREQRRIAEQLDLLDSLVRDLSVGLPAELTARRKQYEYYRDKLLTFKEKAA